MKKYLFLILSIMWCVDVNAYTYDADATIDSFNDINVTVNNDVVISPVNGASISMNDTLRLYNSGAINAVIDTDGKPLVVYNSGTIDGINAHGGPVNQIIRSESEITSINMLDGEKPDVTIQNYENFDFDKIHDITANSFLIKDSSIVMDDFGKWQSSTENIQLSGNNVSLVIGRLDTVEENVIVNHTSVIDFIKVKIEDLDKMYTVAPEKTGGGIILHIVRATNYEEIFNEAEDRDYKQFSALDVIRQRHPNDKLLKALDRAADMNELNRLKNLSYRFSHDILLRPVKMLNGFSLMNSLKGESNTGIGVEPFYILSDKTDSVGGRLYFGYEYDNLYFYAGLNLARFDYSDSLNEFSGMSYGLDVKSKQMFNKFWLVESLGFSLTDFSADYISENGEIKNNPTGTSFYADLSAGYDFVLEPGITLAPVVGFAYQPYHVADISETDAFLHGGLNAKYFFVVDGIKYEYGASGMVGTNGNWFADLNVGFMSVIDSVGASINVGAIKDDFDTYYKLSLNAKVVF